MSLDEVTNVNSTNYSSYYVKYFTYSLTLDLEAQENKTYYTKTGDLYEEASVQIGDNVNGLYELESVGYKKATSYSSSEKYYEKIDRDQSIFAFTYKLVARKYNNEYFEVTATVLQEVTSSNVTLTISIFGERYEKIIGKG